MSTKSLLSELQGMSAVATKVYHAVPINEQWSSEQIHSELIRQGHSHSKKITQGCLSSLKDAGLIREPSQGAFTKDPLQAKERNAPKHEKQKGVEVATATVAPPTQCPIDRLTALATHVRDIQKMVAKVADDIEAVAFEIIERDQDTDAEMSKLKQLKQLLKDIG